MQTTDREERDIFGSGRSGCPIPRSCNRATHSRNGAGATWPMDAQPDSKAREPITNSHLMKCPGPRKAFP